MFLSERANRGNLIIRSFDRTWASTSKQLGLDPNREELCVQSTSLRPHSIEVPVGQLLLEIDVLIQDSLNGVSVHVNSDGPVVNSQRVIVRLRGHVLDLILLVHFLVATSRTEHCKCEKRN